MSSRGLLSAFAGAMEGGGRGMEEVANSRIDARTEKLKEEALVKRETALATLTHGFSMEQIGAQGENQMANTNANNTASMARTVTQGKNQLANTNANNSAQAQEGLLDRASQEKIANIRSSGTGKSQVAADKFIMDIVEKVQAGDLKPEDANVMLGKYGAPLFEQTVDGWEPPDSWLARVFGGKGSEKIKTTWGGNGGASTLDTLLEKINTDSELTETAKPETEPKPVVEAEPVVEPKPLLETQPEATQSQTKINPTLPKDPTKWNVKEDRSGNLVAIVNGKEVKLTPEEETLYLESDRDRINKVLNKKIPAPNNINEHGRF